MRLNADLPCTPSERRRANGRPYRRHACYTEVKRTGRTSIMLDVEVWVLHQGQGERVKGSDAFTTRAGLTITDIVHVPAAAYRRLLDYERD
jgi:hypothetical protein